MTLSQPAATGTEIPSRAWAEMILLSLVWGASFLSIAIALTAMGPFTAVLHRVGWAALLLWAFALALGHRLPRGRRVWTGFFVMGILNNVLPFSLMAWGQTQIESGLTAILNAATAIFAILVAAALFRDQKLSLRRLAGVLVGFSGVVLAIGAEALSGVDLRALGQIAVLGGAFSYALAAAWARVRLAGLPPVVSAAGMTTCSALTMLPLVWAIEGTPRLDLPWHVWAAIGWYAVPGTAIAYLLYYRILGMAGPGNLLLVTLMIPVVAIALGTGFLGERLAPAAIAGFGLLALGLLILDGRLARLPGRRRLRRKTAR